MAENRDWLRVRGMGRERFAGYLADYLRTLGYEVERTDSAEPGRDAVNARLSRMNPAVPASAKELQFRLYPTAGGSAVVWVGPTTIVGGRPGPSRAVGPGDPGPSGAGHPDREPRDRENRPSSLAPAPVAGRLNSPSSAPRGAFIMGAWVPRAHSP